jgi:F-type H+-transporting ATPase subunit epsilon
VLDEKTEAVTLPMFDGERGVLTGHTPFVGQLGPGELRFSRGGTTVRYFIDGGFAQVARDVINVLTPRAMLSNDITPDKVTAARTEAEALPANNNVERETRNRSLARAQGMAAVAKKN